MAYNLAVKGVTYAAGGYICYEIIRAMQAEKKMRKLDAMKQFQSSTKSETTRDLEKEVQEFTKNHYGRKVAERMSSQSMIEEQVKAQIADKKETHGRLLETLGSQEEIDKLENDLKKLEEVFTQVKSNKQFRAEDFR